MSLSIRTQNHEKQWDEIPNVLYRNRGNFINDNYLEVVIKDTASNWIRIEEIQAKWREAQHIFKKVKPELHKGMHEPGELDPKLILPFLIDVLGFKQRKKKFTPPNHETQIEPDHLLFQDLSIAKRFWCEIGKETRDLKTIVSICESKSWDQPLDIRKSVKEPSPHEQVLRDLRLTGASYAILTNGHKWRLYSKESLTRPTYFFEMSLPLICESEEPNAFEMFYNFFSLEALHENSGESKVAMLQRESLKHGSQIEKDLRLRMYSGVEYLLDGLHSADPKEELADHYHSAIMLMYRILFVLKAEDSNLLPIASSDKYSANSLRSICEEASRLVCQWDLGKDESQKAQTNLFDRMMKLSKIIDKGDAASDVNIGFNGGLFSDTLNPRVFKTKISNYQLANALFRCTRTHSQDYSNATRVNFDSVNYHHIGSVYEGLLEFSPAIAKVSLKVISNETSFEIIPKSKKTPEGFQVIRNLEKGDIYLKAKEEDRKNSGSYYTPQWLVSSTLQISGVIQQITEAKDIDALRNFSVCDPAMGSGHFLVDIVEHIIRKAKSLYVFGTKDSIHDFVEETVLSAVFGTDKNELAVNLAKLNVWLLLGRKERKLPSLESNFKCGNSLIYTDDKKVKSKEVKGWFDWKQQFQKVWDRSDGFIYVVGNPPWGGNISEEKLYLESLYPGVAADNLNSFDLFIRQSERLISPSGTLAFVVPRNFIRTNDYASLRKHIHKKIKFIADAGAAFDGVTQEAVVFGLGKDDQNTFNSYPFLKKYDVGERVTHLNFFEIPTSSVSGPQYVFNLYWKKELAEIASKQFRDKNVILTTLVSSSRGIEYGGNGEIAKCPHCTKYITLPKKKKKDWKNCNHCDSRVTLEDLKPYNMISKEKTAKHTVPVYSGRDIQRYSCKSPKYLQPKLPGINYKTQLFDGKPTIFITKISPTIKCDIALNGEYVTQGVYTLKQKSDHSSLEWIAAVLNSEAMRFFYEFIHNVGATLTTNVLLEHLLKMKIPAQTDRLNEIVASIKALKKAKPGSSTVEIETEKIDAIVFKSFGINQSEIASVRSFLEEIGELKQVVEKQVKEESADYQLTDLEFNEEAEEAS